MIPYYSDDAVTVHHGDCRDVLADLEPESVDAVVCDPPYDLTNRTPDVMGCVECGRTLGGADGSPDACPRCGGELSRQRSAQGKGFMGQEWDATGVAFDPATWAAVLRVLKPGGHLLAFGGTRTFHRMTVAIEDAGFEVRDCLSWLYGSGFPKSLDVSKALDKAAGAEREVVGTSPTFRPSTRGNGTEGMRDRRTTGDLTAPATDDAQQWEGFGTALKPAWEPIVLARKPLAGTVAANVTEHGTGALNIDGCRVAAGQDYRDKCASVVGLDSNRNGNAYGEWAGAREDSSSDKGRWPANVTLDDDAASMLDQQAGDSRSSGVYRRTDGVTGEGPANYQPRRYADSAMYEDNGGPSRFFYTAKANRTDRGEGNTHPTVKPVSLMRWLVRMVTPPGGLVLDPFAGSGTTAEAAIIEGFRCVLIEAHGPYLPIIEARLSRPMQPTLDGGAA